MVQVVMLEGFCLNAINITNIMVRKLPLLILHELLYIFLTYPKPPTISPGLIFVRKPFLMGLYTGGLIYGGGGGGLIYRLNFVLASY